jgi:predicted nucleic acid-binding protein
MKVFLDANVLISVLNKEYPVFTYSSRILSSTPQGIKLYTSPLCLAIAFYFSEKKSGRAMAKAKLNTLSKHVVITDMNKGTVVKALENKKVLDLEDGLEYYSAIGSDCKYIITEDLKDFYFSDIEVLDSKSFFEKHLKK